MTNLQTVMDRHKESAELGSQILERARKAESEVIILQAALDHIIRCANEWEANKLGSVDIQRKRWKRLAEIARSTKHPA